MGKYVTYNLGLRCKTLVQGTLPMDTGNLRYNATKLFYSGISFEINVGGEEAPYFEWLQDYPTYFNSDKPNPYYKSFERKNFAPVFNYLKTQLNGRFAGGRFLVQRTLTYRDVLGDVEKRESENTLRRQQVFNKFNSREG